MISGWYNIGESGGKLTVVAVLGKLALGNNLVLVVLDLGEPTHILLVTLQARITVTYQP